MNGSVIIVIIFSFFVFLFLLSFSIPLDIMSVPDDSVDKTQNDYSGKRITYNPTRKLCLRFEYQLKYLTLRDEPYYINVGLKKRQFLTYLYT